MANKIANYEKIELDKNLPIKLIYFYYDKPINSKIRHWHRSLEIIIPIIGYTVIEEINNGVHNKFKIQKGDFYVINCRSIHSFDAANRSPLYEGYALQISYEYLDSLCTIDKYHFNQPNLEDKDEILNVLMNIISCYKIDETFINIRIRSLIDQLIYLLMKKTSKNNEKYLSIKSNKNSNRINHIMKYINNHYNENITVSDIADHLEMSRTYLSKLFKNNMGINIKEYISNIRLQHAIDDLIMTDYPIIDIALNNGFPNIKSFNSYFKKEYKQSPLEYRKHNQKKT